MKISRRFEKWFEEKLNRKNVFFAPILLQNSLKPSLGQYETV